MYHFYHHHENNYRYHQYWIPYPVLYQHPAFRQFPLVNPSVFMSSASAASMLLDNAKLVVEKVSKSKQFSTRLMNAAQQSKTTEVETIIKSTGIKNMPKISYTPDGLHLEFNDQNETNCCHLVLMIRWR
ncbi:hypothetical protein H1Z61_02450 [Bacillus aquiflavi]|uniref:Uncharacterized protein n=1 Tax=Bacillus aquiflavi TaxID=2672567 RepID=A0A6B3VTW5_9BACI|nr:hypothetical protein [Bacillus aquiflavi]MBA4536028.1 hypothetical protein [Bacillus aquiflavi]NEY80402.1 hypothetical protein [Bacillus aquiflavi]UAC47686.1 hypothetical protein K6959_13790 [Bacillus aquiflavi]